jgi:glutathione S-transferase
MKLYIAKATCSRAPQTVINETGLDVELVLYDIRGRTASNNQDFGTVNRFRYVPVLELDHTPKEYISEASVITAYLADLCPQHRLIPPVGTLERLKVDQTLVFIATEIAQKHISLMRKHMNEDGVPWALERIAQAYAVFDERLADGRSWLAGEQFSVLDTYLWATMWEDRSGAQIDHLSHLAAWKTRTEERPSVRKTLADETAMVEAHAARAEDEPQADNTPCHHE